MKKQKKVVNPEYPWVVDHFIVPCGSFAVDEDKFSEMIGRNMVKNGEWVAGWKKLPGGFYQIYVFDRCGDHCPCCGRKYNGGNGK